MAKKNKPTRLSERAMLIHLSVSMWTGRTKDEKVGREVTKAKHADQDAGSWWTYLVPKSELKKLDSARGRCRTEWVKGTLPFMDGGLRILPCVKLDEYRKRMSTVMAEYEEAVDDFLTHRYPKLRKNMVAHLGRLSEGKRMPSTEELRNRFAVKLEILPVPDIQDFRVQVADDEIEDVKEEMQRSIDTWMSNAMTELWNQFSTLVGKIETTMKQKDKKFKNSIIANLASFCKALPHMNLTDDPNLERLRREATKTLAGLKPDTLRTDTSKRKDAHEAANKLLKKMKSYSH